MGPSGAEAETVARPPTPGAEAGAPPPPSLAQALRFWWLLGWVSFGGPAGQIGLMHEGLVQRRRWIGPQRFAHALNYCLLLPGPEAQQLATYLGWLLHRSAGGIAAGVLFVLPSLLLMVALGWAFMAHGEQRWMQGLVQGLQPAVLALVLMALWRMGRQALQRPSAWVLAALAALALGLAHWPYPLVVLLAALWGAWQARAGAHGAAAVAAPTAAAPAPAQTAVLGDDTPTPAHALPDRGRLLRLLALGLALWALPLLGLVAWGGAHGVLAQMGWFFTKAAFLTFGGAYAVLPYVGEAVVFEHRWISTPQLMAALALGESTPGPLIMVLAFMAYVGGWQSPELAALGLAPPLAGALAALVATWFTFLPSFLFILGGGPWVEASRSRPRLASVLHAIGAAVIGVMALFTLTLARHTLWPQGGGAASPALPDLAALGLTALAWWALRRGVGAMPVVAVAALLGLLRGALG